MTRKAMITGCEGFIGSYVFPFLLDRGYEVLGTLQNDAKLKRIEGIRFEVMDMRDRDRVKSLIQEWKPTLIVHLAAQSLVMPSWADPVYTIETNVLGTLYLLESVRQAKLDPLILLAGSSAEYGWNYQEELPIKENKEFRPTSPYAATKVAADALTYAYFAGAKLRVIRMRLFNITGPGKIEDACSDFARGIAELENQGGGVLEVGNLNTIRDILDVRDAVQGMWFLVQNGIAGEAYNICSGSGTHIWDALNILVNKAKVPIEIHNETPQKMRPVDEPVFIGDNSKLRALGWQPEMLIEKTMSDMLDYWRKKTNSNISLF